MVAGLDLAKSICQTKLTEKSDRFRVHQKPSCSLFSSLPPFPPPVFGMATAILRHLRKELMQPYPGYLDHGQAASFALGRSSPWWCSVCNGKAAEARSHSSCPLTVEGSDLSLDTARRLLRIWHDQPESCTWVSQGW